MLGLFGSGAGGIVDGLVGHLDVVGGEGDVALDSHFIVRPAPPASSGHLDHAHHDGSGAGRRRHGTFCPDAALPDQGLNGRPERFRIGNDDRPGSRPEGCSPFPKR
jgi:hypothetical protein